MLTRVQFNGQNPSLPSWSCGFDSHHPLQKITDAFWCLLFFQLYLDGNRKGRRQSRNRPSGGRSVSPWACRRNSCAVAQLYCPFGTVILYSPSNCAKRNITRRKLNITAKQYHSPQANRVEKTSSFDEVFSGGAGENRTPVQKHIPKGISERSYQFRILLIGRLITNYRLRQSLIHDTAGDNAVFTFTAKSCPIVSRGNLTTDSSYKLSCESNFIVVSYF